MVRVVYRMVGQRVGENVKISSILESLQKASPTDKSLLSLLYDSCGILPPKQHRTQLTEETKEPKTLKERKVHALKLLELSRGPVLLSHL